MEDNQTQQLEDGNNNRVVTHVVRTNAFPEGEIFDDGGKVKDSHDVVETVGDRSFAVGVREGQMPVDEPAEEVEVLDGPVDWHGVDDGGEGGVGWWNQCS